MRFSSAAAAYLKVCEHLRCENCVFLAKIVEL